MTQLVQGRLIEVKRPVWISNMDAKGNQWSLNENGKPHGVYDAVVIAHNGIYFHTLYPLSLHFASYFQLKLKVKRQLKLFPATEL